ncbi:DNA helicase-2/ATP-dependent DNA helicase PcrA [Saccharothrix tamanrassetensis]|uniref:DNA 3'-5' helicase n=1 Tax=Saccharothrix tamanrassetensis TaxID=1051531 RepID=A0A841CFL3_9PSEU|nr:UvrD-helicase domain-containing protein [Saccharothrix tamanrassetensis]MBB5956119.1 DNA helicase-2/ATP-dependent DNA helicase PcrA [Saccharothrix tamanrassetensis]
MRVVAVPGNERERVGELSRLASPFEVAEALGLPKPTPEQAAVVAAPTAPALVVAGAGAGKTETMAARVVYLVANGFVTPDRVLGLTFTRKAARQLSDRVRARLRRLGGSSLLDDLDPSGERRASVLTTEPVILTYHAYAGRLVGEHGLRLPVEPGVRLLTETAAWQLAHRVVSTWTEDIDTDKVPATVTGYLLALAGELGEHLVEPTALRKHAEWLATVVESAPKAPRQRDALPEKLKDIIGAQRLRVNLLPLLEAYQARKRREAAMDFADQMSLAARLASEHPEVVRGERERYGAVLLDEYQDTGHAQRVLLRSLFGRGEPMSVTSVGDPAQAIYGWRGASAANLPRFVHDFPPARKYGLLTSFRNPPEVLTLANAVSAPLRAAGLDVEELRARPGAGPGDVRMGLFTDIRAELDWMADTVAAQWEAHLDSSDEPPTAAVLVRRRADMAGIAAVLRERGLPVEVVGLGGLLDEPEVRDLTSALRVLVDPLAGTAAARLLTGSRWRVAAVDLAALWQRARELAGAPSRQSVADNPLAVIADALPGEHAEQAGLADALDDPGDPTAYSAEGYRRIRRLGAELSALRRRLDQPLPELVADVERTLLLDIEAMARPGGVGRAHLDAFADVVADFAAASPSATLPALLDYLYTAEHAEDGLEPGEVEVAENRVQVLTMHSAKGLEWHIVALPHVVKDVFPGRKKTSCWLKAVAELPADLRGDAEDLPKLRIPGGSNRKEVEEALDRHADDFEDRRLVEERRLLYVALTRSEHSLLVSGHWWAETGDKPKGPSAFLTELRDAVLAADHPPADLVHWAPQPEEDEPNPLASQTKSADWPADPLGKRRAAVAEGAELVLAALERLRTATADTPPASPAATPAAVNPAVTPAVAAIPAATAQSGVAAQLPPEPEQPDDLPPEPEADYDVPPDLSPDHDLPLEPTSEYDDLPPEPPEDYTEGDPADQPGDPADSDDPADLPAEPDHLPDDQADPPHDPADVLDEPDGSAEDPEGWARDVDVLLAERAAAADRRERVVLPEHLSVSQLVELAADPDLLARRLRRPLPFPPNPLARRGTAFHTWLEQRFGASRLLDLDELPGAADEGASPDTELGRLQEAFLASRWADRTPHDVEVPFEAEIEGLSVRGRMDAVFADPDGGWTVVDWKTGAVPDEERMPALSVQLAAYRLAWAALAKTPVERVRAAFHYVRHDHTLRPADLLDADGLRALIRSVPS